MMSSHHSKGNMNDHSDRSTNSLSPFRRKSRMSQRVVPPPRPRFERSTSEHMLPTDSLLSPNKCVFSSKHRLVRRDLPFFQSKNRLRVTNQHTELRIFSLLRHDWFHIFLRVHMWLSLLLLLGSWTIAILIWAGVYMAIDRDNIDSDCGLGAPGEPIAFGAAFAFSLETCTTVGYGLPSGTNAFFEECSGVQVAIYFQMVWSMMFNAFLFAFFFARIAKCEARGIQVIFSNKAIISHRPDVPYPCFQFRVFDVDGTYPVVEAHVRIYVVTQKSPIPIPLRIVIPNDDMGAMLYLSLPSQVVHAMDAYSPMVPKHKEFDNAKWSATVPGDGLHLRQVDSTTNNRDDVCCPVCGESYGTVERLIQHGKYQKMVETHDEYPYEGSHQEVDWDEWADLMKKSTTWTLPQLQAFFRSDISEVLCVVEGIDPLASGTFQALHSYQIEDIHFGEAHFADCVCMNTEGALAVDLDFFHRIRPNSKAPSDDSIHSTIINNSNRDDSIHSVVLKTKSSKRLSNSSSKEPGSKSDIGAHIEQKQPPEQEAPWPPPKTRAISPPKQPNTPPTPDDDASSQMEPRHLMFGLKPNAQQSPALPPGATQSSPSLTTQSLHTPKETPDTAPPKRRNTLAAKYDRPPPLFKLDSDLTRDRKFEPPTSTDRAPSRASMPSNMMNSLVTGKFD